MKQGRTQQLDVAGRAQETDFAGSGRCGRMLGRAAHVWNCVLLDAPIKIRRSDGSHIQW
jgi:hypothetical protein